MPRLLNLGCGQRFHPDWVNLDLHSSHPQVQPWDLHKDLPFPDDSFDAVYHSHVLEHFPRQEAPRFLERCRRVLHPGGTLRVVVPDLEQIARLYLQSLDKSLEGDPVWRQRYEWILLELYDQTVRESSGGEMLAYLRRDPIPERNFISARLGGEFRRITNPANATTISPSPGILASLTNFFARKFLRLASGRSGIQAYDAFQFRRSGEIHRWMYDRYSLTQLLETLGFREIKIVGPAESRIPNWSSYHLDTEPDGSVYKPDSLFVEATRP